MAPIKCSYHNCLNTSLNHSIFRFPVNDQHRLRIWLENAGNMILSSLTVEELHNRFLCDTHFDSTCILSEGLRTRLHKDALPQPYSVNRSETASLEDSPELKVKTPTKVYRKRNYENIEKSPITIEKEFNFPTPSKSKRKRLVFEPLTTQIDNLKNTVSVGIKKIKSKNIQLAKLKKKVQSKHLINLNIFPFKSNASKVLTTMQLKKKIKKWTEDEKNLCLSLYYKSPAVYNFLRKSGIILASPTTIRRWLARASCLPGLTNESFVHLKKKFSDSSDKEKACVICFDEMSIMSCLEYTQKYDVIEGFEDFGGEVRSDKIAKYALVFVARGFYHNWKVPLCYVLSGSNVKADKLQHLIKTVIKKTFEVGLLPKCITCDQGTTNVSAIKKLGATIENPFLMLNEKKIFVVFDVPHLIKKLRNNLLKEDYILNRKKICFQDIIQTYDIDKNNKSRSLKKITPIHLNPNSFQKMRVSLATQIFSHSVASVIKTVIETGELKSNTALNTAEFVETVNNLFDSLNSRRRFEKNPYKCALTSKNNLVRQTLTEGLEMAKNLKKLTTRRDGSITETAPPCFEGLQQTIAAILQLFDQEQENGTKFILTNRLNQDVIENLFGLFRMKTGCNRNPTARVLRAVFRSNLLNSFIKLDTTNCEADKDHFVGVDTMETTDVNMGASTSSYHQEIGMMNSEDELDEETNLDGFDLKYPLQRDLQPGVGTEPTSTSTLEECSVAYFSGWLGKKAVEKHKCAKCKLSLLQEDCSLNDKKQLLILHKTYANIDIPTLKSPTPALHNIIDASLSTFETHFCILRHKKNVSKNYTTIKKALHCRNIDLTGMCGDHFDFVINKLVETKIYAFCKTEKKKMTAQASKKVRVLSNL